MIDWSTDISQIPRGRMETVTRLIRGEVKAREEFVSERILAANRDGKVYATYWIPTQYSAQGNKIGGDRWSGWCEGDEPVAWAPWPIHPLQEQYPRKVA